MAKSISQHSLRLPGFDPEQPQPPAPAPALPEAPIPVAQDLATHAIPVSEIFDEIEDATPTARSIPWRSDTSPAPLVAPAPWAPLLPLDIPTGAAAKFEDTSALLMELAGVLDQIPEVRNYQAYAGTAAPINFNGLVRQYYLREGTNLGDLQVNLVDGHAGAWWQQPRGAAVGIGTPRNDDMGRRDPPQGSAAGGLRHGR